MIDNKKVVVIIPARGESERIPRKNMVKLDGKPLIYYSIKHSLDSDCVDRTIVSTEDAEIKEASLKFGAEVLDRPSEFAQNTSSTLDVLKDAVNQLKDKEDYFPEIIVVLQPTSPIREDGRIDQALKMFVEKNADMVVSLKKRHLEPKWILKESEGKLEFIFENDFSRIRDQEQKDHYELNGSITVYSTKLMMGTEKYVFGKNTQPLPMTKKESLQVDAEEDLCLIRKILEE